MSAPLSQIDLRRLRDCSGGDRAFEQELLELFVIDSQTHIKALKAAIATQDLETISRSAHHLKGASSNVGAHGMQTIAQTLEQQATSDQWECLRTLVNDLEATWTALVQEVKTWTEGVNPEV